MQKRVVVTGASGHIGYHVALQLVELGFDTTLLLRKENQNTAELKNKGAKIYFADLLSPNSYQSTLENCDVLFHIASENTTNTNDEKRVIQNTFELSKIVIDTAISKNVKTIVYTSSVVVLGRSSNSAILINENNKTNYLESPYVKGKFLAEEYCDNLIKENNIDIRRLYPSWVVGNNDLKLTPPHKIIKNYFDKGQKIYFSGGISVASANEVAKAHINAWLIGKANEKYIVGGNNISFKEFYSTLSKYSGHKAPSIFIPKVFIYLGAIAAKLILGKKSSVDPQYIKTVIGNYSWYDSQKAKKELNYSIPAIDKILSEAIIDTQKKVLGVNKLVKKNNPEVNKLKYDESDILLITGFPGWLGNRMVDVLMNGDRFGSNAVERTIRLLVQPKYKNLISLPANFEIVYGDLTDEVSLKNALENVKTVYHLAGVIYPKKVKAFNEINFIGTKILVDSCIEKGIRRIVFMGTDSICGYGRKNKIFNETTTPKPYKNYGKSKYAAEKYIFDKTTEGLIDGTSLRGFWFFGPFMPDRNKGFFKMFYWKKQIVFGNGKNFRSISHVDNITQAFLSAEKNKNTFGKWYWIGDKTALPNRQGAPTVDDIYKMIAEGLDVKYNPFYIPRWMCELFAILDSFLSIFGILNATIHAAGKFHKNIAGEITAAEKDFNYKPNVGFEEIKKELNELIN